MSKTIRHPSIVAAITAALFGDQLRQTRYQLGGFGNARRGKSYKSSHSRRYNRYARLTDDSSAGGEIRIRAAIEKRRRKNEHRLKCRDHGGFHHYTIGADVLETM